MRRKSKIISNRVARHERIRKGISGTTERPRLCVFRSHKHFEAQLIDDGKGHTLLSASTRDEDFMKKEGKKKSAGKTDIAKVLGGFLAEKAKAKGIAKVVFDRAGYLYHGRVKAFADAARAAGLEF